MIKWRLSDDPIAVDEEEKYKDPEVRKNTRCSILLGITSNMSSCGMREYIRYLAQHKMVSAIV
jgi:deoxyhypusine synthase